MQHEVSLQTWQGNLPWNSSKIASLSRKSGPKNHSSLRWTVRRFCQHPPSLVSVAWRLPLARWIQSSYARFMLSLQASFNELFNAWQEGSNLSCQFELLRAVQVWHIHLWWSCLNAMTVTWRLEDLKTFVNNNNSLCAWYSCVLAAHQIAATVQRILSDQNEIDRQNCAEKVWDYDFMLAIISTIYFKSSLLSRTERKLHPDAWVGSHSSHLLRYAPIELDLQ